MGASAYARSTSWGAVLGGWFAALGALAILFPLAAVAGGFAPTGQPRIDDPTLALPLVLALFASWLIGGYVGGRMAGYRRSWHGLMSAVWGLFVALVVALVAGGSAAVAPAAVSLPGLDVSGFGNAAVFGFVLGILSSVVGGWLGGLLSPAPFVPAAAQGKVVAARGPRMVERREPVPSRPAQSVARGPSTRVAEPSFWDKLTGRGETARQPDVARERELTADREREAEPRVPPARPIGAERDGEPTDLESEARR